MVFVEVITRRDKSERKPHGADYLSDHYSDVCRPGDVTGGQEESMKQKVYRQQQDLEKLLLRADKDDISTLGVVFTILSYDAFIYET